MTLNFSLGQWPFLMRAGIFEGKERALDVEQSKSLALDVDESSLASAISFMLAAFTNSASANLYDSSQGHLFRLSPVPPGADWTS